MGQCLISSRAKNSKKKKKKKKNCHPNWGWNDIFYYRQASTQTSFRCYHFCLFIIGIILRCWLCFHVTSTPPWSLNSSWASTSLHFVYYEYYRFERAFFTLHPFLFSSRLHWELAVQRQRQQGFMLCLVRLFVWITQQSISVVCNREYYFWLITCVRKFSYKLKKQPSDPLLFSTIKTLLIVLLFVPLQDSEFIGYVHNFCVVLLIHYWVFTHFVH